MIFLTSPNIHRNNKVGAVVKLLSWCFATISVHISPFEYFYILSILPDTTHYLLKEPRT